MKVEFRIALITLCITAFAIELFASGAYSGGHESGQNLVHFCPAPSLGKDPVDMDCHAQNVYRANMNSGVPKTLQEMEEAVGDGIYRELPPVESVYHNLKEPSPLETMSESERAQAYSITGAVMAEWKKLEELKNEHPNWTPEQLEEAFEFRFLDPSLPNRKFVSKRDGKMEAVYNRNSGVLIDRGINQGTYNLYTPDWKRHPIDALNHLKYDVGGAAKCGVNVNEEKSAAESVSVTDLKAMKLDDPNGDWCQCDNPGCVNTFRLVDGKHDGYIRFGCTKCKKVNVKFAKEAIRYEQILKEEGSPSKWFGPNAEANAKAAGNAK